MTPERLAEIRDRATKDYQAHQSGIYLSNELVADRLHLLAEVDRLRAQNAEWQETATHALDVIDDLKRKVSSVEALASKLERRGAYVTGWQGQAAKEIRAALRGNDD